ncbi:Major egg antigen (P40) [Fasciola gigantica]|uniref:Major egg antigen (P40) n=1 Tax=Fasciola gigantica TaxID=46835 RepID=A0A504Y9R5_FASGI|nr:Major egg antigen (P40) [Fasciola gigantica]
MRRMRQNAFVLVPSDTADLDALYASGVRSPADYLQSILSSMDRQIEALRKQMTQPAPVQTQCMLTYDKSRDGLFGPIVPQGGLVGGPLGFLKDAFQLGEDGKVKFHLQFDVRGYEPEHVQVKMEKHWLSVSAKKSVRTATGRTSSEYCRTVYVPNSVDEDKFECQMTEDGVLVVEAPVKHDDYRKIKFDRDLQLCIKPRSDKPADSQRTNGSDDVNVEKFDALQVTGKNGPVVQERGPTNRLLHVEIPIESGFTEDDLSVRVDANRLIVSGRKQTNEDTEQYKGHFVREFTRSYSVPETVDPFSMEAQLRGNTVVVEAPLVHSG